MTKYYVSQLPTIDTILKIYILYDGFEESKIYWLLIIETRDFYLQIPNIQIKAVF